MNWYEKLNEYFPVEEMKSKQHMELLLKDKKEIYYKDESEKHVLMYVESDTFVFIDYLWVSPNTRGQGIGHQLMDKLKAKNKPIILEVEPFDYDDSDSEKRLRFYQREGFEHAKSIGYNRRSLATSKKNPLEILYWTPANESEEMIYKQMKRVYETIHSYNDKKLYGDTYEPVHEALTYDKENEKEDIFQEV